MESNKRLLLAALPGLTGGAAFLLEFKLVLRPRKTSQKAIVIAAAQAQKAADYILNRKFGEEEQS